MNDIIKLEYHGNRIDQREDRYLNATQMAKANGKLWGHYFKNQNTHEYLRALSSDIGIPITELVFTKQGGRPEEQGTWIHPRVAINYGQWLSPEFAVWVSNVVYGHLKTISDEKNGKLEDIVRSRVARERRLFAKQAIGFAKMAGLRDNQALIAANRATRNQTGYDFLSDMGLNYLEAPEQESLINASTIGTELGGWSAIKVNQFLQEHDFQVGKRDKKGRGYWEPTDKGIQHGAQMVDVERSNKTGQSRQLLWASSIVDVLKDLISEGVA